MESVELTRNRERYGTDTSRQRHDHARHPSCNTAIEGFDQGASRALRDQSEDGGEVEKRAFVHDAPMGPKAPRSTVFTAEEEHRVAFRKHTLLPLDDCLYALQATIPHLTRSSLHRCFQRHGISRLPESKATRPPRRRSSPIRSATSTSTSPRSGRRREALPLEAFLAAYNFAKRLKTLRGLTPYEFICKRWNRKPGSFQAQSYPPQAGTKHLKAERWSVSGTLLSNTTPSRLSSSRSSAKFSMMPLCTTPTRNVECG